MLENTLERFNRNIMSCLTGQLEDRKGLLIKKHNDNLQTHGDYSFPIFLKSWHEFSVSNQITDEVSTTIFAATGKEPVSLVEASKDWDLPVQKVKIENGRLYLFLERPQAIRVSLVEALKINAIITQRLQEKCCRVVVDPLCVGKSDITSLRTKYVYNVISNICAIHNLDLDVFVTSKSTSKREQCATVFCGTVLSTKTGNKETSISAEDYIRLRQDEMTLIAQHKYGVRVTTDTKWKDFVAHLGESAAAFELLQTRLGSPVKINFDTCAVGSSKGASFILYNCARLETIIRTYNGNVSDGTYPELPQFDHVDFSLLTQEDEWCLIFNYILGLPSLLNTCADTKGESCEFRPHNICNFLCSMVRVFSQYYRRVRILTEPRKHLLPVMFARIHMLAILKNTLKTCLNILNIKSVSQM